MNQALSSNKLYQKVTMLADYFYGLLTDIPEEERYLLAYSIRTTALESISTVAEACGAVDPRDSYWKLGQTRRSLFGLQSMVQQAHKRGYVKLDPEKMLLLDQTVEEIDAELLAAKSRFAAYFKMLEPDTYKRENHEN